MTVGISSDVRANPFPALDCRRVTESSPKVWPGFRSSRCVRSRVRTGQTVAVRHLHPRQRGGVEDSVLGDDVGWRGPAAGGSRAQVNASLTRLNALPTPPNLRVRFLPAGDEPDVRNWQTNGRAEEARLGQFVTPEQTFMTERTLPVGRKVDFGATSAAQREQRRSWSPRASPRDALPAP